MPRRKNALPRRKKQGWNALQIRKNALPARRKGKEQTQVSGIEQEVEPGRKSIMNAISDGGFGGFQLLDEKYYDNNKLYFKDKRLYMK